MNKKLLLTAIALIIVSLALTGCGLPRYSRPVKLETQPVVVAVYDKAGQKVSSEQLELSSVSGLDGAGKEEAKIKLPAGHRIVIAPANIELPDKLELPRCPELTGNMSVNPDVADTWNRDLLTNPIRPVEQTPAVVPVTPEPTPTPTPTKSPFEIITPGVTPESTRLAVFVLVGDNPKTPAWFDKDQVECTEVFTGWCPDCGCIGSCTVGEGDTKSASLALGGEHGPALWSDTGTWCWVAEEPVTVEITLVPAADTTESCCCWSNYFNRCVPPAENQSAWSYWCVVQEDGTCDWVRR